eukprot:SAG22_NODE_119_length_19257_cov_43.260413_16_plen_50_part_00
MVPPDFLQNNASVLRNCFTERREFTGYIGPGRVDYKSARRVLENGADVL